jgi:hypothetical protein
MTPGDPAAAVRLFTANETARLGARIEQIRGEVRAGTLTPTEVFTAMALAYEDHAEGIAQVRRAFTAAARRHLAEPETGDAATCRSFLATLLATD